MLPTANWFCPPSTKRHSSYFSENKSSSHRNKRSLAPSAPPSPNIQQHNTELAHPNDLPISNPIIAPNLTVPIPHATLINQPPVNNSFQNNNNQLHKVVRPVAAPVPNMP